MSVQEKGEQVDDASPEISIGARCCLWRAAAVRTTCFGALFSKINSLFVLHFPCVDLAFPMSDVCVKLSIL